MKHDTVIGLVFLYGVVFGGMILIWIKIIQAWPALCSIGG
jgi:hypothetical protein